MACATHLNGAGAASRYFTVRNEGGLRTNISRQLGMTTNNVVVGYDAMAEVSSWTAKEANGTSRENEQLGYGYDAGNNLHLRTNNALVQTFAVDTLNQLSSVTRSGTMTLSGALPAPASGVAVNGTAAQTYGDLTFAAAGNTLSNGTNTFTIAATNAYGVAVTNTLSLNLPTPVNFQYDANGNLTSDGTRSFYYDAENRLTNVTVAGQYETVFAYDGLSRRRLMTNYVWQSSAWTATNASAYIYDGLEVLQERNASNNTPTVTYTRGLDLSTSLAGAGLGLVRLLARADGNGTTYYHADGSGNITALINFNQVMVARYEYDAFGRRLAQSGSMAAVNEMGFSSFPTVLGMVFSPGRPYLPELQRWLNRDPIGEEGGINLYQFNRNNPARFIDPSGLIDADRYEEIEAIQQAQHPTFDYYAGPDGTVTVGGEQGLQSIDLGFVKAVTDLATPQQSDAEAVANLIGQGDDPDVINGILDGLNLVAMAGFPEGAVGEELAAANRAKSSLSDLKAALKKAKDKVGKQPKCKPGKYGSPQRGTPKKGYRLDPGHPNRPPGDPENGPHINWWDYTAGKRGSGGQSGAIPVPPDQ